MAIVTYPVTQQGEGIGPELAALISLATSDTTDIDRLLDVTASLLEKGVNSQAVPSDVIRAGLVINKAIRQAIGEANRSGRLVVANSRRGPAMETLSRALRPMLVISANRSGSGAEARKTLINSAREEFDAKKAQVSRLCNRHAWVNEVLRESGLPRLTEEEQRGIPTD